jgi:hexosaminidase
MSWRGQTGGNHATALGRRVIMTPQTDGCYLDYKYTADVEEPGQLGISALVKCYGVDPITPVMTKEQAALVLGGQGNLWSELIYADRIAEYMIFPRICALAEAFWTRPELKDYAGFQKRLQVHQQRLDKLGLVSHRP